MDIRTRLRLGEDTWWADLEKPFDISLPISEKAGGPNCFWALPPAFHPVRMGDFVGDTREGGAVNFMNVQFNPHGNGTHTECVGHIARERITINDCLISFHFPAQLVSISPETIEEDKMITQFQLENCHLIPGIQALICRTLPNDISKKSRKYSGTNPPYFEPSSIDWLVQQGILHLVTDLPSIDREEDGGKVLSHRAFFQYPDQPRMNATITELVYIPDEIPDGVYLLNLQVASFELDASPSRPLLYPLVKD